MLMFLLLQGGLFWVSSSIRLPETEVFKQTTSLLLFFFFLAASNLRCDTGGLFAVVCGLLSSCDTWAQQLQHAGQQLFRQKFNHSYFSSNFCSDLNSSYNHKQVSKNISCHIIIKKPLALIHKSSIFTFQLPRWKYSCLKKHPIEPVFSPDLWRSFTQVVVKS